MAQAKTAGENIKASDFHDESTGGAGKIPVTKSNGKIDPSFVDGNIGLLVAGEDIEADKLCFIEKGGQKQKVLSSGVGSYVQSWAGGSPYTSTKIAFAYLMPFKNFSLEKVKVKVQRNGGASSGGTNFGQINIEVYDLDVNNRPNNLLGSGNNTFNTWNAGSEKDVEITFASAIEISDNNKIAIAIEYYTTDTDDVGLKGGSTNALEVSQWNGSAWVDLAINDAYVQVDYTALGGFLLKSDSTDLDRQSFDGFSVEEKLEGENIQINMSDIFNGLTGLTTGERYFMSTDGALTTTENDFFVGIAVSETAIKIQKKLTLGAHEDIVSYGGNNSITDTRTAETDGFFFGYIQHTGASITATYTPKGGTSKTIAQVHSGESSSTYVSFCIPVQKGDSITLSSTDGGASLYFRPLI